ncbi:Acyl carrier protein [Clostridiaceae bacterium JG1575]|nr:Acyl carrier protein [Clostridiaceae bacterium JG1575]
MVFEKVRDIIADKLGMSPEEIRMDMGFEDLGADSLDLMEVIMALEDEFDLTMPEDEASNTKTVADLVQFIQEARGEE